MIPTLRQIIERIMRDHVGTRNGIPRRQLLALVNDELAVYCQPQLPVGPDGDNRELRLTYVTMPYITGNFGLAIPATWDEIQTFERYIFSKVPGDDAARRVRIVKGAYQHLAPQPEQLTLGMEG